MSSIQFFLAISHINYNFILISKIDITIQLFFKTFFTIIKQTMNSEQFFSHQYIQQETSKNNRFANLRLEKNIKIFQQLYQTKSVRETAKMLNLSPATISKSITTLEDALRIKLFNRRGCEGMTPTTEAEMLNERTNSLQQSLGLLKNDFQLERQTDDIRILAHKLAYIPYIFPAISASNITTNVELISCDANKAYEMMCLDKIDIALFPLPLESVAQIDAKKYNITKLSQYHIFLYLNKKHNLSKKREEDWTFNDLKTANIVPQGETMFPFFKKLLNQNNIVSNNNVFTKSLDLNVIYEGIKQNYWTCGIGKEFEDIFDCSQFCKKDYNKSNFVGTIIYWFLISNKETNEITKPLTDAIIKVIEEKNKY